MASNFSCVTKKTMVVVLEIWNKIWGQCEWIKNEILQHIARFVSDNSQETEYFESEDV